MTHRRSPVSLLLLACVSIGLGGQPARAAAREGHRTPKYPLKRARRIYDDDDLRQARENIDRFARARAIARAITERADRWRGRPDAQLLHCLPTADVPRAFNVGTAGCPICGKAIYAKAGTYPWRLDLDHPFQVQCPICGRRFPDNDFAAYYASGFRDKKFLEGHYADDGWGWVGPDGQRYWFVAYANHWNWYNTVLPAIRDLARAYLLSGEKQYAHKAAVMLFGVADVYPAMDYHRQSRYGRLQAARGARYEGKTVNGIWETTVLHMLAESYDAVWETIDDDQALQKLVGKSGEQIRAHIEANLLEEGIEAVFDKRISGNYGMHQRALIYAALARDGGPVDRWLDSVLVQRDPDPRHLGLRYALYNLVYRDGIPYETSPGYNFSWVRNITEVAETLAKADRDVYSIPKTRLLYGGVMDLINIGRHTPALGDSGSVAGGRVGCDPFTFQAAYRAYRDDRILRFLGTFSATGNASFSSYETLMKPVLNASPPPPQPRKSRLLDGYGMGILNNQADSVSVSLYYGRRGGHGHFDRLHFDLFACGLPMTPDLGYPDFMNAYVPGIFTWSKNTIAHNTVTVGAARQDGNRAGTVRLFADGLFARVIDVHAPGTYADCPIYDRRIVMVDIDDDRSYLVDLFTVEGGTQHDYSLHGPPGDFRVLGGTWSDPAPGTLAGEEVAVGQIYDDPAKAAPNYAGSYANYRGSGFQHLEHVRRHLSGDWCAEWQHARDGRARLRVRIIDQPDQQILLADARISPVKQKQPVHYVIARRKGPSLRSRFVAVLEPFYDEPRIRATRVENAADGRRQLVIERSGGWTDTITLGKHTGAPASEAAGGFPSVRVETTDPDGKPARRFAAGPALRDAERPAIGGRVLRVDPSARTVRIRTDRPLTDQQAASLVGRVVHFRNRLRQTAHPVVGARREGTDLVLRTGDALRVGRAHVTAISATSITSDARFEFPSIYRGTYLTDEHATAFYPVRSARADSVTLAAPLPSDHGLKTGRDAWLVDVGPNDRLAVPAVSVWQRP